MAHPWGRRWLFRRYNRAVRWLTVFLKRLFDLVFSLCVSVVLVIPVAVVCAFICLESPGNPLYAQDRIGKGGKTIKILKLRSMVADAGNVQKYLSPE